jgi:hypothetical protein
MPCTLLVEDQQPKLLFLGCPISLSPFNPLSGGLKCGKAEHRIILGIANMSRVAGQAGENKLICAASQKEKKQKGPLWAVRAIASHYNKKSRLQSGFLNSGMLLIAWSSAATQSLIFFGIM